MRKKFILNIFLIQNFISFYSNIHSSLKTQYFRRYFDFFKNGQRAIFTRNSYIKICGIHALPIWNIVIFLRGHLKSMIYNPEPKILDNLKQTTKEKFKRFLKIFNKNYGT